MFCNTTGHPIINRTWYYNGVELKYRYIVEVIGNLSNDNSQGNGLVAKQEYYWLKEKR